MLSSSPFRNIGCGSHILLRKPKITDDRHDSVSMLSIQTTNYAWNHTQHKGNACSEMDWLQSHDSLHQNLYNPLYSYKARLWHIYSCFYPGLMKLPPPCDFLSGSLRRTPICNQFMCCSCVLWLNYLAVSHDFYYVLNVCYLNYNLCSFKICGLPGHLSCLVGYLNNYYYFMKLIYS